MKSIRQYYIAGILLLLMIVRAFASGDWFGSIVVAGVFVSWIDLIRKLIQISANLKYKHAKDRAGLIILVMSIAGFVLLVLAVINIINSISWLTDPLVLDELTLVALFLCISQDMLIDVLKWIIGKDNG